MACWMERLEVVKVFFQVSNVSLRWPIAITRKIWRGLVSLVTRGQKTAASVVSSVT